MLLKIIIMAILTQLTISVQVFDIPDNDTLAGHGTLLMKHYCPSNINCGDRSHMLCSYNPNVMEKYGPNCLVTKPTGFMSKMLKRRILCVLNAIRSRVALGKETGKDNKPFPRGYGIYKIEWDKELAALADVRARQCGINIGYCLASARFSDPFTLSTSGYRYDTANITKTEEAITEFVLKDIVLDTWYKHKFSLEDPLTIPPYSFFYEVSYQEMVSANVTHVGCGMTTFHSFQYQLYSSPSLVCFFSHSVYPGHKSYHTNIKPGHSPKCGCPPGSREEDKTCLCIRDEKCSEEAEPNVILLPIVEVEDAVPKQMPANSKRLSNPLRRALQGPTSNGTLNMELQDDTNSILLKTLLEEINESTDLDEDEDNDNISDEEWGSKVDNVKLENFENEMNTEILNHILTQYAVSNKVSKKP